MRKFDSGSYSGLGLGVFLVLISAYPVPELKLIISVCKLLTHVVLKIVSDAVKLATDKLFEVVLPRSVTVCKLTI